MAVLVHLLTVVRYHIPDLIIIDICDHHMKKKPPHGNFLASMSRVYHNRAQSINKMS